jgi:acyl-CoA reductase-like NAD-dependent aldehyde dehydrogenase
MLFPVAALTSVQTRVNMDLQLPQLRNFINGEVDTPTKDRGNALRNPNTGEVLQQQLSCDESQVETALAASDQAWESGEWEHTPALERAAVLDEIANRLEHDEVREQLAYADAVTTGAVINLTRRMAQLTPFVFRGAAQYLRDGHLNQILPGAKGDVEYFRSPWGPALLVSPWNGPTAIGSHKIASALAAGAPCIMKPSEWAPHSAIIMGEVINQMDLPHGTFQLTCGSRHIGAQMLTDPRIKAVSFTGGLAGGRAIAAACGPDFKPTQLELGGNNPLIVFADADLDAAASGIVYGLTNLNAQWCRALGRLLIHKDVKQALLDKVQAKLSDIVLGSSLEETSDMGPMIHQQQYQDILAELVRLQEKGGSLISATPMPDLPGYFIPPTLVDGCKPEDTTEEIFGPVANVHTFETTSEALALANGTPFGLAGYVYSANEAEAWRFARKMRTGGVKINGYSLFSLSGQAPRGAWGLSGLGEEGTGQSIEFFTGSRVVGVSGQDPIGGRA